jgi:hypothetical protein
MMNETHISRITIRAPKSRMTPAEYTIWNEGWNRLWGKLLGEAIQQVYSDRANGMKSIHTPKREIARQSLELAKQLDIELPKSFARLRYDHVFLIKCQLQYEINLKNMEREGCEVVFEPPRKPSAEIIALMIERAKSRKAGDQASAGPGGQHVVQESR